MMTAWLLHFLQLQVGGNSVVLLGSLKYNAIDLDKFSVLLLELLAFTDLLTTLTLYVR